MGATLPVLAKHVARRAESLGRRVGLLYAVNTLGGVAGSFLCGFVMIELLGVSGANAVAIGVNLAIGIAALVLDRWGGAGVPALPGARAAAPEPGPATIDAPSRNRLRGVTLGFALAGATSLAYEVLLTRLGIFFLWDTTIYSFATMLTTFLARGAQVHQTVLVSHMTPYDAAYQQQAQAIQSALAPQSGTYEAGQTAGAILGAQVTQQATLWAYVDNFRLLAVLAIACIPGVFLLRRLRHKEEHSAAAARD